MEKHVHQLIQAYGDKEHLLDQRTEVDRASDLTRWRMAQTRRRALTAVGVRVTRSDRFPARFINRDGVRVSLGVFGTFDEAAARNQAAKIDEMKLQDEPPSLVCVVPSAT